MNFLIEFFLSKLKTPSFLLMCCTVTVHCEVKKKKVCGSQTADL